MQNMQRIKYRKQRKIEQNNDNTKIRESTNVARQVLLIRGPGIRVPTSAPKSRDKSQDLSRDFFAYSIPKQKLVQAGRFAHPGLYKSCSVYPRSFPL